MSSEHKENRLHNAHPPGKPKQKKRAQVRLACTNCRKAHACCDDTRPCKRCVKNSLGASCSDTPRRRRTAGSSKKSDEHEDISTSSTGGKKRKRHSTSDEEGDSGWTDEASYIQPQPTNQEIYPTMSTSGTQQMMSDTLVAPTNNIPSIGMAPMDSGSQYASSSYSSQYSPQAEYSNNGRYIQPQVPIKYEPQQASPQNNQCYYPLVASPPWRGEETQSVDQTDQLMRVRSPDLAQGYNNGNYYNPSPRATIFPHRIPVFESYKNSGYPTAIWTFNTRLLVDCNKAFEDLIMNHCKLDQNSIVKYKNFLHSGKFSCFDLFPTYFLPYANECYTSLITEITATDKSILPAENAHEMVFKRPDGGEISVLVTCSPVFGANRQHPGCPQVTHYVMQIIRLQSMPARPKATSIRIEPYEAPIQELPAQEPPLDQFNNMALNDNSMQYESTPNQYYGEQQQMVTPNGYVTQQQINPENGAYNAFEDPNTDFSSYLDPQTPNPQYYNDQYLQNMTPLS